MNNKLLAAAIFTCALTMFSACGSQNIPENAPETHVENEAASDAASTVPDVQETAPAASTIPKSTVPEVPEEAPAASTVPEEQEAAPADASVVPEEQEADLTVGDPQNGSPRLLTYIDAWEEWHTMEVDPTVGENIYDPDGFVYDDESGWMTYASDQKAAENGTGADEKGNGYTCLQGVDVSEHQGMIDWTAVADAGYSFAFIRVGYRGYGKAGNIFADDYAVRNLQEAKDNGLKVGAYFFSQALNEEEARAEAALALDVIEESGVVLDLPLMYDPEIIKDDVGRANDITRSQVRLNTAAFREYVESSSDWKADIYSNLPWEHEYFDGETLNQYAIWYADYERIPQTPYHFTWWQYTNKGSVPGIEGNVDLNLWIRAE